LPATSVQLRNSQCRKSEVVGQKHKVSVVVLVEEAYPSKLFRIVLPGIIILGGDDLVALQSSRLVDG
jgi:bifunctional ADP-heptose synthase (sugar kinase/adenylyltransferase)